MGRFRSRLMVLGLGVCALLSACQSAPPLQRLPEMTFTKQPPIRLNVARVEVVSEYTAPAGAPHIEYDMPVSPENALRRWVQDRLKPVGKSGILRVVIHTASATETPLATDKSFTGMFKKEQAAQVDLNLDVTLQMLDEQQFTVADVSGKSSRSRTEPEGQKLNDRDKLLYDMTYDLLRGFNEEVDPNIRSGFYNWLDMN